MRVYQFILTIGIAFSILSCDLSTLVEDPVVSTSEIDLPRKREFAIALHGGAGYIEKGQFSDSIEQLYRDKLSEAIEKGHSILEAGGSSIDAVVATIKILEDSPLFNAGKGAVLSHSGQPELDASIMDGKTLKAGAVAGVSHIKNPIDLANTVMSKSKHVLLAGVGAEQFAHAHGFDFTSSDYFITPERLQDLERTKASDTINLSMNYDPFIQNSKMGTVGCVALDKNGNLAAGTSTGGLTNKKYGRIGDSPIIGAGTYANNETCAVSCTGVGEYFIRGAVAYDMSALMEYKGLTVQEAAQLIVQHKQPKLGGVGGLIAMDKSGNTTMEFNTPGMFRAKMDDRGELEIKMYGK